MKNRFERLSRKEKKEAINEYKKASSNNEAIIMRLNRLKVIGIIGIIYSLIMFTFDLLKEKGILDYGFNTFNNIYISYIIDAFLLIMCAVFVIKARQLLSQQVNKYLIEISRSKEDKKTKKKK